jgi:dolichyl-phosphate beta-glucosyltransferase
LDRPLVVDTASTIDLSVVVPAYNEAARLDASLDALRVGLGAQPRSWEILVVDDGSVDSTAQIAEAFAKTEPRVRVHRRPHLGKGAAVKAGLLAARGAHCFMCDADLSMPVSELVKFFDPKIGDYDVAIGTREGFAARRIGEPQHRHVMGRLFNAVVQRAALPGIEDSQCGFKMFTRAAVQSVFPLVSVDGWAFDLEVLLIARAQRLRVVQVPIEWHYRPQSRVRLLRDGIGMLRELFRLRGRARRGEYDRSST